MPIYAPFTDALPTPAVDPLDPDGLVAVCLNKAYLPYILGALAVYTYDDAFNLTGASEALAVQRFNTLISIFAGAIQECGVLDFDVRQNEEEPCILEKFVDGEWVQFANLRLCPPLVRLNVNFEIEISFDDGETWETLADNPTPPIPTPIPEQDNLCLASASSVVAFNETYKEMKRLFQDEVSVYTIAAAIISLIGTFIFFPPAFPFVFTFFVELYALLGEITDDEFDSDTQDEFRCLLYQNGEIVDGAAVYNFDAISTEVQSKWGLLDLNIWTAIDYLLRIVGADGLNRSGSTGVVAEEDCTDCGEECATYHDTMAEGIGPKTHIVQVDPENTTFYIFPTDFPDGEWTDVPLVGVDTYVKSTAGSPHAPLVAAVMVDLGQECLVDSFSFDYFKWGGSATCDLYIQWVTFDGAGAYQQSAANCRGGGPFGWYTEARLSYNTVSRYFFFIAFAYDVSDTGITNLHIEIT